MMVLTEQEISERIETLFAFENSPTGLVAAYELRARARYLNSSFSSESVIHLLKEKQLIDFEGRISELVRKVALSAIQDDEVRGICFVSS